MVNLQGRFNEVLGTIAAVVADEFPKTRTSLDIRDEGSRELIASLLENVLIGKTGEDLRKYLHDSPEGEANRREEPEPEPEPRPDPSAPRVVFPVRPDGTRAWMDGRGGRPLLLSSYFTALYWAKHDRARLTKTLDLLKSWGCDGIRYFVSVATDYWDGRRILPVDGRRGGAWPDFNEAHDFLLKSLRERGMCAHITAGDGKEFHHEEQIMAKAAEVARHYTDVLCMVDWNEAWQNCRDGENPQYVRKLIQPIIDLGIPWATSAHPRGDDKKYLDLMTKTVGAPICTIHGPGGTTAMVRHIFNHRLEGARDEYGLWQGEPRGPGEDVSAGRVDHTGWIVLAAAMSAATGQGYVLHHSRGIRDRDDDAPWEHFAPYFQRSRRVLDHFPRRNPIAWGHGGRGGSHPEAVLVSTRPDGAFHEDKPGIMSQFHRIDVARLDDGRRIVIPYGGVTGLPRLARAIKSWRGKVVDTHGNIVQEVVLNPGDTWTAPGGDDGYILIPH